MAIANRIPEGRWDTTEQRSHYWMVYKKFYYFDDATGSEFIEIQQEIRKAVAEVKTQLQEHQIDIINVSQQQFLDAKQGGRTIGIAVAFKSREDLAMAKILVECDE